MYNTPILNREIIMSCCEPNGFEKSEIDGVCPDCEEPTVGGEAFVNCSYSPIECRTCGWSPCDQSC